MMQEVEFKENNELLIVDRSLALVPNKSGSEPQRKEFLLEDHDPVWLEMRHLHIAEASERLSDKMQNFMSKNKAAQLQQRLVLSNNGYIDGSELSTREIQKMVPALPQYNEQMEKLSLHVEIAEKSTELSEMKGLEILVKLSRILSLVMLEQRKSLTI